MTQKDPNLKEKSEKKFNTKAPDPITFVPDAYAYLTVPDFLNKLDDNHVEEFFKQSVKRLGKNPDILKKIYLESKETGKVQESLFEDRFIIDWKNIHDKQTTFLDDYKLIPENRLTIISGKKGAGKTHCILSYLASLDKKFIYFSDGDNMPDEIKRVLKSLNALERCNFLVFEEVMKINGIENILKYFKTALEKTKSKIIYLDPFENLVASDSNNANQVAYSLSRLQSWAYKNEVTIIISKNFRKGEIKKYTDIFDSIGGSHKWTTIPRSVLIASRVEKGAKFYPKGDLIEKEMSLLWQLECNYQATENKILFEWDNSKKVLKQKERIQFPNRELFQRIFRKERDLEKEQTEDQFILQKLIDNTGEEKKEAGKIQIELSKELEKSPRTIKRRIKTFIDKKWIELKKTPENKNFYNILDEKPVKNFIEG